jgi:TetR/AcrR family transcriptional repressor of lmrAB and yxaGH operons
MPRPPSPPSAKAPTPATSPATGVAALGTRERLVHAMSRALQQRGYHGVGLAELLSAAGAPKGVLYHHFPGGKQQLAVAAINATAAHIAGSLDRLLASRADPLPALAGWLSMAQQQLVKSGFERGCPLATVALETTAADGPVRAALATAFARIRDGLAQLLAAAGIEPARAGGLAALVVAAYEGALLQARVAGNGQPMAEAAGSLLALLERECEQARSAAGAASKGTR